MKHLTDVYHIDIANDQDGFAITFHGKTTAGNRQQIRVSVGWWMWSFIVREAFKAWRSRRESMLSEVKRIDEAFPSQPQP